MGGNSQSKSQKILLTSAIIASGISIGYLIYYFNKKHSSVSYKLDYDISKFLQNNPNFPNKITTENLIQITTLFFKYSYLKSKENNRIRRNERITLLENNSLVEYANNAFQSYIDDEKNENDTKNYILAKLGITLSKYEKFIEENASELQQKNLGIILLDTLNIPIKLTKEQAKLLHIQMSNLQSIINITKFAKNPIIVENGIKMVGQNWQNILWKIVAQDKLYKEFGLDEKEIALNLRKYGYGLT